MTQNQEWFTNLLLEQLIEKRAERKVVLFGDLSIRMPKGITDDEINEVLQNLIDRGYIQIEQINRLFGPRISHGPNFSEWERSFYNQPIIDNSVNISGINNSNIAVQAENVTQAITSNNLPDSITENLVKLIEAIKQDPNLSPNEKEEYLQDTETINKELSRSNPRKEIILSLLNGFGSVASLASLAMQLVPIITKAFGF